MPKFEDNKVSHFRHLTGRFGQKADGPFFKNALSQISDNIALLMLLNFY
jgi:hypothetical protein